MSSHSLWRAARSESVTVGSEARRPSGSIEPVAGVTDVAETPEGAAMIAASEV